MKKTQYRESDLTRVYIALGSYPISLHDDHRRPTADVFSRLANKSLLRFSGHGAELKSINSYYSILNFIHTLCRLHSGAVNLTLIDGNLTFPLDLTDETDR